MIALHRPLIVLAVTFGLAAASPAAAKPQVVISVAQSREIVEVKDGVPTPRLVPTTTAVPGDVLEYALTYENRGDEAATGAVIDNPIPQGTIYVASSATGKGAEITFSADAGRTFAPPVKLTYELRRPDGTVEKRTATPAEYTHVRWTVQRIPAGASGTVTYRVKVK